MLAHLPATSIVGAVDFTAYDQFCGYLILDALVANRDRHEENWAVLRDLGGRVTLAPSYDHGNSLGFNLGDRRRTMQLAQDPGLATWASRGHAERFEDGRNVPLVDFACLALCDASPGTAELWLGRLHQVTGDEWRAVVSGIPEMSEVCRTFCVQLLMTNQRRLLDGRTYGAP